MNRTTLGRSLLSGVAALVLLTACESKEEQAIKFAQSGQEYLADGDLDRAELQFNNALYKDPINLDALRGAAEVAKQKDEPTRQSRFLARLLNEVPDDVTANLAYARLSILGGAQDQALEHAERVLEQDPSNSEALTIKGAALVVSNRLDEATEVLNQALEQDPDNAEIFNLLAAGEIRSDNYEEALATVNEGIAQAENPETLLIVKLVLAEQVLGEDEVIQTFEDLIEAAPENGLYRQRYADYVLLKQRDYAKARQLYADALPHLTEKTQAYTRIVSIDRQTQGDAAAEQTLLGFVEQNPEDLDLRFSVPVFYCQTGQRAKCDAAYKSLAEDEALTDEDRLRARTGMADTAIAQGELDRAEQITDQILAEDDANVAALTNKAQIMMARGESEAAIPLLRTALNGDPDNAEALVFLALAYEQTDQIQFADSQFARAVDEVGYTKPIVEQYRAFLLRRGENGRAQDVLERYLAANPSDLDAVIAKAQGDVQAQDFRTALETADRILARDPQNERAKRLKLAALVGAEQWQDALPLSEELVTANPADRRLLSARARVLSNTGSEDEAMELLDARTRGEDTETADFVLFGEALLRNEDYDRAREVAERGLAQDAASEDLYIIAYLATKRGGDEAGSADILYEAAEKASQSRRARTLLSNDLIVQGRMDEAVAVLRTLEADNMLEPLTANNLASLLLERPGNEAEALRIAERFRGTDNPYFADTLAWAYYKNDRIPDASRLSRQAADGAPNSADILYHRGVIAAAEGDRPSAESALLAAKRAHAQGAQVSMADIDAALEEL
ncbi:tetratricopeptide repeat protein [Parvularcula dongshanensis]|uniref:Tetratricopeptide (TPR) repeat protein n=1 Tax=Parvularcula dongshanensis TaxID=1173995 RepID=A0A840I187_9PROT|nr:tetratricopeptide repeat protein [Parvularcula dongshanensis]MBB4658043.1 tetratricopeptide (TPR) repeat protein [Parvularcula dongshanensis]